MKGGSARPKPVSVIFMPHIVGLMTLRQNTNFSSQINPIPPVQPHRKKYSPSGFPQISSIIAPSHPLHEGRIAIVTNVGMGCGGRGSVGRVRCVRRAVYPWAVTARRTN